MIPLALLCILILTLLPLWALSGMRRWNTPEPGLEMPVTILVPFRNEADRIRPLLHALENMQYDQLEIIFINDHSTDVGPHIVEQWVSGQKNTRLIHNRETQHGKKHALQNGVSEAAGSVVLTTDADCRMGPEWVSVMSGCFRDPSVHMVAGLIAPDGGSGPFYQFIQLEMAALTGISAGSLGHHVPTMCNGANLAFRRSSFLKAGGHTDTLSIPSGDDEFLLHKMHKGFPGGVHYCVDRRALVYTDPLHGLSEWIQQRVRWSSKWKLRKTGRWQAPVLAFCYLGMIAGWGSSLFPGTGLIWLGIFTFLKFLADYLLLRRVMKIWQRRPNPIFFLGSELLYPVYVVIFALLSFTRQYEWKGRRYKEALT